MWNSYAESSDLGSEKNESRKKSKTVHFDITCDQECDWASYWKINQFLFQLNKIYFFFSKTHCWVVAQNKCIGNLVS